MPRSQLLLLVPLAAFAAFSVGLKANLLERPDPNAVLQAGAAAPPIVLEDLSGERFDLEDIRAEKAVVLVNFWATWCAPCRVEMPILETAYEEHRSAGLEILAITSEDRDVVEAYVAERGYSFPILLDPGSEVGKAYGVEALPTTVVVDANGKVVRSWRGLDPSMEMQINRLMSRATGRGTDRVSAR